jgi:phage-related protein
MAGANRTDTLRVDANEFGDGYIHRATRGLNPVRPAWTLTFPFKDASEYRAFNTFLTSNACAGFYFQPPEELAPVFVTANEWSMVISDRRAGQSSGSGEPIVGTLQATFTRSFNPQPPPLVP